MPTTPYGIYYPDPSQAPATAADLMQMASTIGARLVLQATDAADRDAKYGGAPAGTAVVAMASGQFIWFKTDSATPTWATIYKDTGWVEAGFTPAAGFSSGEYAKARNRNGNIDVRVSVSRTGSSLTASNVGNIGDTLAVTVPTQFTPRNESVQGTMRATNTGGTAEMKTDGSVQIVDMHTNSVIANSDFVRFQFYFMEG